MAEAAERVPPFLFFFSTSVCSLTAQKGRSQKLVFNRNCSFSNISFPKKPKLFRPSQPSFLDNIRWGKIRRNIRCRKLTIWPYRKKPLSHRSWEIDKELSRWSRTRCCNRSKFAKYKSSVMMYRSFKCPCNKRYYQQKTMGKHYKKYNKHEQYTFLKTFWNSWLEAVDDRKARTWFQ